MHWGVKNVLAFVLDNCNQIKYLKLAEILKRCQLNQINKDVKMPFQNSFKDFKICGTYISTYFPHKIQVYIKCTTTHA